MGRKRGVILSYALMIFEVCSTLFLTPFIIRTLGQAEYGVYKLSSAIGAYLLLLDLGVGNAVIRFAAKYRAAGDLHQCRKFLGVSTIYYFIVALLSIAAGAVLVFLYPNLFSTGLQPEEIILGQKLLAITIANAAVTLGTAAYTNIISAYERFDISKGSSILQIFVRMFFTYMALKQGFGSIGICLINLTTTVLCRGCFVIYVVKGLHIRPIFRSLDKCMIRDVSTYSSFILLQMIATQINAGADQILLGMFVSSSASIIAIYGVGQQISQYFQSIGTSVTSVLMPGVVKLVEEKASPQQLCHEMVRVGRLILMVLAFIWVCFLLYGRQFIVLWAGQENASAFVVAALLLSAYVWILTEAIGTQILWAMNAHKEQSILKIVIVLINICLTLLLIRWKPLVGAALGTFISLFFGDLVVMNVIFSRRIKISLSAYYSGLLKGILPSLLICGMVGFAFRFVALDGWFGFAVNIMVMSFCYLFCMFLFGANTYEKHLIGGIVNKIFRSKKTKHS